jgi:serine/threonine-protein kinase
VVSEPALAEPRLIGRYALYDEIAAGGMATVHLGRLLGPVGFSRTVAIKRLHPQFARDPEFVAMFLDEARLAARIRHPNVVPTLDVVALDQELFLVMEYVQGESLARMVRASRKHEAAAPLHVLTTIMAGVLHGLHAAHEARTEQGEPLAIVHRDVSPQNVLVGLDGVPRVLDFGVAKAAHRAQTTRQGQVKGKIAYMAPEQLRSEHVDRRCDVFAAAAVLWEAVTRKRLYQADSDAAVLAMVLLKPAPSPRTVVPDLDPNLERIIMRGLERDRDQRYATAREMAQDLETCLPVASASAIGGWVERLAGDALATRARRVTDIESHTSSLPQLLEAMPLPGAAVPAPPASMPSSPALMAPVLAAPAPAALPSPAAMPLAALPDAEPARASRSGVDDVATTLSQVTQGAPATPRGADRRRVALLAAGAALLVVGAVFVGRASTRGPEAGAGSAVAATQPSPSAAPATASAAASTSAAPAPSASPEPTASASAPAPRAPAAPRRGQPAPAPSPPPARPARPAANCNPPYTVDGAGIRHMKPECL